MSMRLFTKEEFEANLKDVSKLTKTNQATSTTEIWKTEGGFFISVPILEENQRYPDYILDEIYRQLKCINGDS